MKSSFKKKIVCYCKVFGFFLGDFHFCVFCALRRLLRYELERPVQPPPRQTPRGTLQTQPSPSAARLGRSHGEKSEKARQKWANDAKTTIKYHCIFETVSFFTVLS